MVRRAKLDDDDRELTDTELAEMRPARAVLSPEEFASVTEAMTRDGDGER